MPLTLAVIGEENIIKRIGGNADVRAHLQNLGFVAGGSVTVVSSMGGNLLLSSIWSERSAGANPWSAAAAAAATVRCRGSASDKIQYPS